MRFLIEFEGPLADVAGAWFAAHQAAAGDVGWSRLDRATFWRLIRTQGRAADVLPGAKPVKLAEYLTHFERRIESDEIVRTVELLEDAAATLAQLAAFGPCHLVTLGENLDSRIAVLEKGGIRRFFQRLEKLSPDPRKRPAELKAMSERDPRTIVAAGTDALVRAAGGAGLFSVGLSGGPCVAAKLHQAGAGVVLRDLSALHRSLQSGAAELVRAGLLPRSLDAPP